MVNPNSKYQIICTKNIFHGIACVKVSNVQLAFPLWWKFIANTRYYPDSIIKLFGSNKIPKELQANRKVKAIIKTQPITF